MGGRAATEGCTFAAGKNGSAVVALGARGGVADAIDTGVDSNEGTALQPDPDRLVAEASFEQTRPGHPTVGAGGYSSEFLVDGPVPWPHKSLQAGPSSGSPPHGGQRGSRRPCFVRPS